MFKRCFLNSKVKNVGKRVKLESGKLIYFPVTEEFKGVQREIIEVWLNLKMLKNLIAQ